MTFKEQQLLSSLLAHLVMGQLHDGGTYTEQSVLAPPRALHLNSYSASHDS